MVQTRHLVWLYIAAFGAAAPFFNLLIYLFDGPPSRDPLIASICTALSFASVALCITSIVTAIHHGYSAGKNIQNPVRRESPLSRMLWVISLLPLNTTLYAKITSKILSAEVVTVGYLVSVIALFLLTLVVSYSAMLFFDGQGGPP